MTQQFAWQFYAGLGAIMAERRSSEWLRVLPEAKNHDAASAVTVTEKELSSDLARWDDDGGAPRS